MNKQHILGGIALIICFLAFYYGENSLNKSQSFQKWKIQFGVNFPSNQNTYRKLIFEKNLAKIQEHNADLSQTYQMGVNHFTAMTQQEFAAKYLHELPSEFIASIQMPQQHQTPLTADIDWVSKGKVSRVKNQGGCDAGYAFSTTGMLESWNLVKTNQIVDLSQQQIVDCSVDRGNKGCSGGLISVALDNIIQQNGITTQELYPYKTSAHVCSVKGGAFKVNKYGSGNGCNGLAFGINFMPLAVYVDATNWINYKSGVFNNCDTKLNHAVLIVGVIGGNWKVKNSWGVIWGQSGYITLANGNTCGICAVAYEMIGQ